MLPDDLRKFRESIFHTRREFADLLARLRGGEVAEHTVANWEMGRRGVRVHQTDLAAISQAIKPHDNNCATCGNRSVVRKCEQDLCAECALPLHGGQRPRPKATIADHQEIAANIRPFLTCRASA
jgi:hypothetical protein